MDQYLKERGKDNDPRVFPINQRNLGSAFREASEKSGFKISPSDLRDWFINEMGALDVQDRYVDFFYGRTPKSVLAKHYTDYLPAKTRPIYERASLRVFAESKRLEQTNMTAESRYHIVRSNNLDELVDSSGRTVLYGDPGAFDPEKELKF